MKTHRFNLVEDILKSSDKGLFFDYSALRFVDLLELGTVAKCS